MSSDSRLRLTVALRVLNAYTSYTVPSADDVTALRALIPASEQHRPLDELARALIEGEVEAVAGRPPTDAATSMS